MSDRNSMNPDGTSGLQNNGVLRLEVPRPTVTAISSKFPEGAVFLLCPPEDLQPEFIRLPDFGKGAKCPVTGLSRSKLVQALQEAGSKVNVRLLRKKGATRGVVLIDRRSLIEWVNTLPRPEWGEVETEEES